MSVVENVTGRQVVYRYLDAVRKRNPLEVHGSGQRVNHAILLQLLREDIPRLLKLVEDLLVECSGELSEDIVAVAKSGSCAHWGEYIPPGKEPKDDWSGETPQGSVPNPQGAGTVPS